VKANIRLEAVEANVAMLFRYFHGRRELVWGLDGGERDDHLSMKAGLAP